MKIGTRIRILLFVKPPAWVRRISRGMVWRMPDKEAVLYLTFDDGPAPGLTEWILEELGRHQARATFFCVGDNVRKYPGLFELIKAGGHSVGNHTYSHLNSYRTRTGTYVRDVYRAHRLIGSHLFRPPYGRIRPLAARILMPRFRIIMWDVLSMDYDTGLGQDTVLGNVMTAIGPGSIIVFHDNPKSAKNLQHALPIVLDRCTEAGYKFLPLQQL